MLTYPCVLGEADICEHICNVWKLGCVANDDFKNMPCEKYR